jgi:hypothetical protein
MVTLTSAAPRRWTGAWVLVAGQSAYTVWFVLCAYLALARASHFAGHYYVPAQGDRYTAGADVAAGWPWASAVTATAAVGPLVAMLSVAAAVALLLFGHVRGRRAASLALLVSTIAVLATVVVAVTPAGRSVTGWILD